MVLVIREVNPHGTGTGSGTDYNTGSPTPAVANHRRGLRLWPGGVDALFPGPTVVPTPPLVSDTGPPVVQINAPESIRAIVCSPQFSWGCNAALYVVRCESNFHPDSYNYTPIYNNGVENHATGLFQLALPLHSGLLQGGDPYDPYVNTRAAYQLWLGSGWAHWACRPY